MKEAAGEANMTVITIILIGVVLSLGAVILNNVMNTVGEKSNAEINKVLRIILVHNLIIQNYVCF